MVCFSFIGYTSIRLRGFWQSFTFYIKGLKGPEIDCEMCWDVDDGGEKGWGGGGGWGGWGVWGGGGGGYVPEGWFNRVNW